MSAPVHPLQRIRGLAQIRWATMVTTTTLDVDSDLIAFYTKAVDKRRRLTPTARGRLEAIRVRELSTPRLPAAPGSVVDVGGGPGTHAAWMAATGYTVDLLDPVPHHVQAAAHTAGRPDRRRLHGPDRPSSAQLMAFDIRP